MNRPSLSLTTTDYPQIDVAQVARESTANSAVEASLGLELGEKDYIHFPWPTLDRAVGGVGPNRIVIIAAPPEGGKTATVLSLLDGFAEAGLRVVAALLETPADEALKQWACFRAGINYEHIGTGSYLQFPNAREIRTRLKDEISDMACRFHRNVWLHEAVSLSTPVVEQLFNDATRFEADVLMIDHMDHTDDGGSGSRGILESTAIMTATSRRMRQARKEGCGVRLFGTSQMNNDAVRRDGVFGRSKPPVPSDVYMGGKKEQLADLLIGLHRLRRPSQEGDKEIETDIKDGRRPLSDLLIPNTIGFRIMKRRVGGGSNVTIPLGFRNGKVVEPNYTLPMAALQDKTPDSVFSVL